MKYQQENDLDIGKDTGKQPPKNKMDGPTNLSINTHNISAIEEPKNPSIRGSSHKVRLPPLTARSGGDTERARQEY